MPQKRRRLRGSQATTSGRAVDGVRVDFVEEFALELLRAGLMLQGLLCDLLESLPEDAHPDEDKGQVVFEMLCGTIRPVAEQTGAPFVRVATQLLHDASAKVLDDLEAAISLVGRWTEAPGLADTGVGATRAYPIRAAGQCHRRL